MKSKKLLLFTLLTIASTVVSGQIKKLQFIGCIMKEYQRPIYVSPGKYRASYEQTGETMDQGKIIINEKLRTFTIKWINGDEWECKYSEKETVNEHADFYGDVEKTTYTGKWTNDNMDCILIITKTNSYGCFTTLKSRKVVDVDYGIDNWKKIFNFGAQGKCFSEL
jgi:hypothetical protein